jgi:hypothetical protein
LILLIIPPWKKTPVLSISFFLSPFLIPPNVAEEKPLKGCDRKRGGRRGEGGGGGEGREEGPFFHQISEGLKNFGVFLHLFR